MKINIKAGIVDLTPSIKTFIEERLGSLEKYIRRFDEEGAAVLRVEIERTTRHHKKGGVYSAMADLSLPKKVIHAEERADDIRAAIDALKDTLRKEIEKFKEMHEARGGQSAVRRARGK